jgi:hypothetical protein
VIAKKILILVFCFTFSLPLLADENGGESQCQIFFEMAHKTNENESKRDVFSSREIAVKEMDLADKYPDFPKAAEDILRQAIQTKNYGVASKANLIMQAGSKQYGGCNPVEYFGWLKRLVLSAEKYHFTKEERHSIGSILIDHLEKDARAPRPLLAQRLNLKIIQLAYQGGLLNMLPDRGALLKGTLTFATRNESRLESKLETVESEVGEPRASTAEAKRQLQMVRLVNEELQESELLRVNMRHILGIFDEKPTEKKL